MEYQLYVVIEKDEDGFLVGEVPQLRGCYAQGATREELMANIREAISLCLEEQAGDIHDIPEFVGVEKVTVDGPAAVG